MSEAGEKAPAPERVLLVVIASNATVFDELLTALLDIGLTGATVVDSKGMGAIIRQEMPIFAGLASMIPEHTGSRMVFSLTEEERASAVFQYIEEEVKPGERPIAFTMPVNRVVGLSR